ncbi:hypothetical protein [Legionella spiritensis]|uniref:LPG0439 HIT-related domain-containing protein n=1 Tax=Legionella spiritensis TaxID=452 RepID=A0A0W0YXR9_LEGSP|nr:hypothetical protein [Legionella spiritensis]KTD61717.1 hypothetical protein Lspi_2347 [Legionella spiritensis]SNV38788.1 Uncharacterised protein [Legionella spiritensis]
MKSKIEYVNHQYTDEHWAIAYRRAGTSIANVAYRSRSGDLYHYSIILNPGDCRGYRTIIRYLNKEGESLASALNRPYTAVEEKGLNEVASMMMQIYKKQDLIPQTSLLGNNAHTFDKTTGITMIGTEEEPGMLHLHMFGRGNPNHEYIPGVRLRGPEAGLMFDLIAKSEASPYNQHAVKWNAVELVTALDTFQGMLSDYVNSSEFNNDFGDTLQVTIHDKKDHDIISTSRDGFFRKNGAEPQESGRTGEVLSSDGAYTESGIRK